MLSPVHTVRAHLKKKIEDQHSVSLVKDKKEGAGDEASEEQRPQ